MPDLRDGARADVPARGGRRGKSRTRVHDDPFLGRARADDPDPRARDAAPGVGRTCGPDDGCAVVDVRARDAGGDLGGRRILRARLCLAQIDEPQHVHADRKRRRRRIRLQRCSDNLSRDLSARDARRLRNDPDVFRSGCVDHCLGAARPGPRAARAQPHRRRDSGAARFGAADRAPARGRRLGNRRAARRGASGRSPARASGRKGPRRWSRARGRERNRRVDDHRRAYPGRKETRRSCDRRNRERHRQLRDARRARRRGNDDRANCRDGFGGAAQPRAHSALGRPRSSVVRAEP